MTRILYVEDNDDNVTMLKMRLELIDEFEVLVAEDGERGCAMAEAERPDLILMDLELPVIDGSRGLAPAQEQPCDLRHPDHRASAHAVAGAREKALAAGCDAFEAKPVEFARLLTKMRGLLGA